jgi:hypothetical protein
MVLQIQVLGDQAILMGEELQNFEGPQDLHHSETAWPFDPEKTQLSLKMSVTIYKSTQYNLL